MRKPLGDEYEGKAPVLTLRVRPEDLASLGVLAKQRGVPRSAIVRSALEMYFAEELAPSA
jgi:predicted DNA binding CopG/RHH family protein